MNNEEKILQMLEALSEEVKKIDPLSKEVKNLSEDVKSLSEEVKKIGPLSEEVKNLSEDVKTLKDDVRYNRILLEAQDKKLTLAMEGQQLAVEHIQRIDESVSEMQEDITAHTLYILRDAKGKKELSGNA